MEQIKGKKMFKVMDEKSKAEEMVNRVEAVLFSSGKKVSFEDLKKLCRAKEDSEVSNSIEELKRRYNENTSLMIVEENNSWRMTIRERYISFIKKIVTETELTKTVMETLAVIAWKQPSYQSAVIKIRTNKAYDHIGQLEEAGFITTQKSGRTKLIKLTAKFYDYFDVHTEEEVHEMFSDVKVPENIKEKLAEAEKERLAQEAEDAEKAAEKKPEEKKGEAEQIAEKLEEISEKKEDIKFEEKKDDALTEIKEEAKQIVKELEKIEENKEIKFEETKEPAQVQAKPATKKVKKK